MNCCLVMITGCCTSRCRWWYVGQYTSEARYQQSDSRVSCVQLQ